MSETKIFDVSTSDIKIIDYFQDIEQYDKRKFIIFELPDNYFQGIPKMKYMFYESTNTSNNLGYDLWYYTPGIGKNKEDYDKWIVKEDGDDLYKLIENIAQFNADSTNTVIQNIIKHVKKQEYDQIVENYCPSLYDYAMSYPVLKNTWLMILLDKLKSLHNEYLLKILADKDLVNKINETEQKITNMAKSKNVLSSVVSTYIPKIARNITYSGTNIIVSQDIIKYKQYVMPCNLFTRYKFYHKLQLGLQLSHDIWDLLECIEHPLLQFVRNNDFDYKENKYVPRHIPLEKIRFPEITIKNFFDEDEMASYINNVFGWTKDKYSKFTTLQYNQSISDYTGGNEHFKKFILL